MRASGATVPPALEALWQWASTLTSASTHPTSPYGIGPATKWQSGEAAE